MIKKLLAGTALALIPGIATAADLPVRAPAPAPAPMFVAAPLWTGFYVGVHVGAASTEAKLNGYYSNSGDSDGFDCNGNSCWRQSPTWTSVLGGAHLGYNLQFGNLVVGVEGDVNARTGGSFSLVDLPGVDDELQGGWKVKSNWDASVRLRLGVLMTPQALVYATGGVAFGKFNLRNDRLAYDSEDAYFRDRNIFGGNRVGWTVGAGVQYALSSNWSTRIEYRYTDFGSKSLRFESFCCSSYDKGGATRAQINDHRITVGMSYRFGAPSAPVGPVVAAY